MIKTYVKKPLEIQAVQYSDSNESFTEIYKWLEEHQSKDGKLFCVCNANDPVYFIINTLEGDMNLMPGDYLIKGIKGEFYPCKPDIFEMTYQESIYAE